MKKCLFIISVSILLFTSCKTQKPTIIPKALNTISVANYDNLRLDRDDYQVLNTVTTEATIAYTEVTNRKGVVISTRIAEVNGAFSINLTPKDMFLLRGASLRTTTIQNTSTGVITLGYLNNDYSYNNAELNNPEILARRVAIYRAINEARVQGGDGLIEPVISTNVEQNGATVYYKSTVIAKVIKLKTDRELKK
ncbi:MAG: hypothetical protein J1E02_04490 [Coprobacter sp.]|nr:hypothetical protein [Coprobacter sp.]